MALMLTPETYKLLEKRLGEQEAREIVKALGEGLQAIEKKAGEAVERVENKAEFLITQKKFELKDELTKELATKADIERVEGEVKIVRQEIKTHVERLEGMVKNAKIELDRKFTIMFLILLFTTIFLNQNALSELTP
jgi:hypothetical protein